MNELENVVEVTEAVAESVEVASKVFDWKKVGKDAIICGGAAAVTVLVGKYVVKPCAKKAKAAYEKHKTKKESKTEE